MRGFICFTVRLVNWINLLFDCFSDIILFSINIALISRSNKHLFPFNYVWYINMYKKDGKHAKPILHFVFTCGFNSRYLSRYWTLLSYGKCTLYIIYIYTPSAFLVLSATQSTLQFKSHSPIHTALLHTALFSITHHSHTYGSANQGTISIFPKDTSACWLWELGIKPPTSQFPSLSPDPQPPGKWTVGTPG